MNESPAGEDQQSARRSRIVRVLRDVARRRLQDEPLSDEAVIATHRDLLPELGDELRELRMVEDARRAARSSAAVGFASTVADARHDAGESARAAGPADEPRDDLEHVAAALPAYRLLGRLGRGGQGVIYSATQQGTGRHVAIKLLAEGPFATRGEIARFEQEARILGRLRHPNIVTIHESGVAAGRVYLVMDYIEGCRLDEIWAAGPHPSGFSAPNRPPASGSAPAGNHARADGAASPQTQIPKSRFPPALRLFAKICGAVNAAHLQGVIHRDLKPSNVLIDAAGEPHVLDFGLAKLETASAGDPSAAPAMTQTGRFVGSLPWAAPEQVDGAGNVDVRTDVYALGVMLYQLLTGRFPYDVTGNLRDAIDNILRAAPLRPRAVQREIDDEIETIILKCLSKSPQRRYQSAGELARDIGHYLAREPIEAKRDSAWYVLKKTAQRHKTAVFVAVAFAITITASAVTLAWMLRQQADLRAQAESYAALASQERDRAGLEALKADRTSDFLRSLLLAGTPEEAQGKEVSVADVLDQAAARIEKELSDQPEVEAAVRATIGRAYQRLGRFADAENHLRSAWSATRAALGDEHRETLHVMHDLALALWEQHKLDDAEPLLRDALAVYDRLGWTQDEIWLDLSNALASVMQRRGDFRQAERLFRDTLDRRRSALGGTHEDTLTSLTNLGLLLIEAGQPDEAEPLLRQALGGCESRFGENHPKTVEALNNLAGLTSRLGRPDDAEPLYRRGIEVARKIRAADHPATLTMLNNLGLLLARQKRLDEAEPLLREALDGRLRTLGETHPDTLTSIVSLARLLIDRGDASRAETMLRDAIAASEKSLSSDDVYVGVFRFNHGLSLQALDRLGDAEAEYLAGHRIFSAALGPPHPYTRMAAEALVRLYTAWNKPELAREWQAKLAGEAK